MRIKACPFCGAAWYHQEIGFRGSYGKDRNYFRYCRACDAQGPQAATEELADLDWNHRPGARKREVTK